MKKNIFLWVAVFAVGAMSSCSVDKVVDQAEARYIGFDPFANKVTRGLDATAFGHSNFSVFGQYGTGTPTPVFSNQKVEWVTDSWDYNPLKAWVAGQTYHFAAIAPYNASYAAGTNAAGTNYNYDYGSKKYTLGEITVNATPTTQIDYMTANPQDNVSSGASSVSFDFNHILSKIDFIFKPRTTSEDETHWKIPVRIEITKIVLADVPTKNTYTADTWGALVTPEINKVTFSEGQGNSTLVTTSYAGSGDPTTTGNTFDWLVVPQGTTAGSITKTLTITCDVYDAVTDGTKLKSGATASVGITTSWAKNTYYTYTVSIGADILGENPYITFDVASANWSTSNQESDLNVPTTQP